MTLPTNPTPFSLEKSIRDLETNGAVKLATARTIDGVFFDGTSAIAHYGICNTVANAEVKQVEISEFVRAYGARLVIKFVNGNTHATPLLSVNAVTGSPMFTKGIRIGVNLQCLHPGGIYQFLWTEANLYELVTDDTKVQAIEAADEADALTLSAADPSNLYWWAE